MTIFWRKVLLSIQASQHGGLILSLYSLSMRAQTNIHCSVSAISFFLSLASMVIGISISNRFYYDGSANPNSSIKREVCSYPSDRLQNKRPLMACSSDIGLSFHKMVSPFLQ